MNMMWRKTEEYFFVSIAIICAIITSLLLILIIGKIAIEAVPSLNLYFITTAEVDTPGFCQAIGNAIAGTIFISILSVTLATPIAIGTAIYLKKYSIENFWTKNLRFMIDVLSGTPSIVLGIFGLIVIVYYLKPITGGFSLLSGSLALAILIMPVIERATEEAISNVPKELEEGSYALGATKWDTIKGIVIPYSISGIITGIILAVGRAAEESAVVILTAGYTQFYPVFEIIPDNKLLFGVQIAPFQDLIAILPVTVYHAYEFQHTVPLSNGFASAFVLIVIVMLINALARLIVWRWKIG